MFKLPLEKSNKYGQGKKTQNISFVNSKGKIINRRQTVGSQIPEAAIKDFYERKYDHLKESSEKQLRDYFITSWKSRSDSPLSIIMMTLIKELGLAKEGNLLDISYSDIKNKIYKDILNLSNDKEYSKKETELLLNRMSNVCLKIYKQTQKLLKQNNIKEIIVYRSDSKNKNTLRIDRPLQSWTDNKNVAKKFKEFSKEKATIYKEKIKAKNIFYSESLLKKPIGFKEGEVIVLKAQL